MSATQNKSQKRKADTNQAPESKKPKQQQQQAAQPKKQAAQQPKQKQQEQPKKKKQPEPEPEPEEEETDDVDEEDMMGERDEEALASIAKVQPSMDKLSAELDGLDEQMNAEIFAIQKRFLLKKRPVLKKRDELLKSVPNLWKSLFCEHTVFITQLDEIDVDILDALVSIEEEQIYADEKAEKQQIIGLAVYFTFTAGKLVKAGRYQKKFMFNEEQETLLCVKSTNLPFASADFAKKHTDSFLLEWFRSEGADEGILAAHDALSSELLVDPLQLFQIVAEGNPLPQREGDSDGDDDEDGAAMMFDEDDESDDEAPELV
jgi:DNA mismatch repair ATPase MutL